MDNIKKQIYKKIPTINIDKWNYINIKPINEPLVPIGILSNYNIFTSSIYFGEHDISPYKRGELQGSYITIFLREKFAKQLFYAQNLLPPQYYFIIFDGWRSYTLQKSLYNIYLNELKKKYPNIPKEELKKETSKYVSFPSKKNSSPSPHNTGGAVDLAILYFKKKDDSKIKKINTKYKYDKKAMIDYSYIFLQKSTMLDFGCPFDFGGDIANITYFENLKNIRKLNDNEKKILKNRRLLFNIMYLSNTYAYPYEFWHFNSIYTQMGAKVANKNTALYGAISLSYENKKFEEVRLELSKHISTYTTLPKAIKIQPM